MAFILEDRFRCDWQKCDITEEGCEKTQESEVTKAFCRAANCERFVETGTEIEKPSKHCHKCELEKPATEFGKNIGTKDGLQRWCKVCMKEYQDNYKKPPQLKKKPATAEIIIATPIAEAEETLETLLKSDFNFTEFESIFAKMPNLLEALCLIAGKEIRSPAEQAVFFIREGMGKWVSDVEVVSVAKVTPAERASIRLASEVVMKSPGAGHKFMPPEKSRA